MPPPVQYAKSGDLFIAYQVTGEGPIDLIWSPGATSHGEVFTPNTVRDLVAGSGIGFQDRGVHTLKGIPDPRQVLTVAHA